MIRFEMPLHWFNVGGRHVLNYGPITSIAKAFKCSIVVRRAGQPEGISCDAKSFLELMVFVGNAFADEPRIQAEFEVSGDSETLAADALRRFGAIQQQFAVVSTYGNRLDVGVDDYVGWQREIDRLIESIPPVPR